MTRAPRRSPRRRAAACIILAIAAPGCATLNRPYPAKEMFGLTATGVERAPNRHNAILRVQRIRVVPPYDERTFVYRLSDTRYEPDYYVEFIADPENLLTAELIRSLASAEAFTTIVEPGAGVETPLRLETTVTDLYADFRNPGAPLAVIRARFLLLEDTLTATGVVAEYNLEAAEPFAVDAPGSLAEAWGRAWGGIIDQLVRNLSSAVLDR